MTFEDKLAREAAQDAAIEQERERQVDTQVRLRDYFAAKAMNAIIIGSDADLSVIGEHGSKGMAKDAYNIADVMLRARSEAT